MPEICSGRALVCISLENIKYGYYKPDLNPNINLTNRLRIERFQGCLPSNFEPSSSTFQFSSSYDTLSTQATLGDGDALTIVEKKFMVTDANLSQVYRLSALRVRIYPSTWNLALKNTSSKDPMRLGKIASQAHGDGARWEKLPFSRGDALVNEVEVLQKCAN
ncbi:hypothetical protein BDZ97DRAFT_1756342 [Flammula alnicola]|nr:hypothetical protein BDZ97DRAFT_1756342 [Flammula alnicola]